jgi:hypothetical protein
MSTTGRTCRWALLLILVLGLVATAAAQEQPLTATCNNVEFEPVASLDPAVIPVMVTYMVYNRREREDNDIFSAKLSTERLRRGFAADGEFNRIWGPKGIRFVLAGFRTCLFTLSKDIDPSDRNNPLAPEFTGIPDPNSTDKIFNGLFLGTLKLLNTSEMQVDGRKVAFRGMDLYFWWRMTSYPGFGVRPRFGKNDESQKPNEPRQGRPGAVWMGTPCATIGKDKCAGYFAHEAGHFLGLCHCCHGAVESLSCFNYLKPDYCPGLGRFEEVPRQPCTGDLDNRLMSATNPFRKMSAKFVRIKACEVKTARAGMKKVLRFGANGVVDASKP